MPDEISELHGRQKLSNCPRGSYLLYGHYRMRKFAREWIQKYPSIAKINQAIAGPRCMGSERTVENHAKTIKKSLEFIEIGDPELALKKLQRT